MCPEGRGKVLRQISCVDLDLGTAVDQPSDPGMPDHDIIRLISGPPQGLERATIPSVPAVENTAVIVEHVEVETLRREEMLVGIRSLEIGEGKDPLVDDRESNPGVGREAFGGNRNPKRCSLAQLPSIK